MSEVVIVDSADTPRKKRRLWLWIPFIIMLVFAIATGGFVYWALNPGVQIDEIALNALESSDTVTVTDTTWLAFIPHTPPTTGFIFYPGGRVPANAYAPIARQVAEQGYLVVIVHAPLNLAIINSNLANPVMEHFSAVENWVVGGHSLGGTTAAIFANNNPASIEGLIFLASYPANDALRDSDLVISSIYATNDGLASLEEVEASRENLPTNTIYVEITGGNHAQFGYYGEQSGDNPADISHEAQITQTVNAILDLLARIDS